MTAPIPSPISGPAGGTAPVASVQPSASNATTAGAMMAAHGQGEVNSATKVETMSELKKRAPKVYQMMMEGIAMNICSEMKRRQEHLKSLWRESGR